MTSLADRRQSLYEALQALPHWNAYAYYHQDPTLPALMVGAPPEGSLDEDFDGGAGYTFTILAVASGEDWPSAQAAIDELIDPAADGGLKNALEDVDDLVGQLGELTFSDYSPGVYAGQAVFGIKFYVEVTG